MNAPRTQSHRTHAPSPIAAGGFSAFLAIALCSGCATTQATEEAPASEAPASAHGGGGGGGGTGAVEDKIVDDDGLPLAEDNPPRFGGVITATLDSGGYTYAKIKREDGRAVWTAVGQQKLQKGDYITVERSVMMHDFHSKTLGHTFERIVFGTVLDRRAADEVDTNREVIEL